MGSVANYDAVIAAVQGANANATRAYFPPLPEGREAAPAPLAGEERELVALFQDIQRKLSASPAAVVLRAAAEQDKLQVAVQRAKTYFQTASTKICDPVIARGSLWERAEPWIVAEILPLEVRPAKERAVIGARLRKRMRVTAPNDQQDPFRGLVTSEVVQSSVADVGDENADDAPGDDADDADKAAVGAEADLAEDDDHELDADYQTGTRFDDDDGYEENDSGADEATF